ncbi:hypothetical protein [Rathayibacter sp. VKM Ac-2803]|uniref:hypothetical protein n=1 Tax=Rathayibacter sp. VKM Ac-2803 TaxID=2609256 RepID=UPI0019527DA5
MRAQASPALREDVSGTDEPTGELDEASTVDVLEALRGINRQRGVTTVIVTHDAGVSEHVSRTVRIRDGRTSTETLRRVSEGDAVHSAEEFAVLDRFGRLQLPEEFTGALGLRDRVRLGLEADHIRVQSGVAAPAAAAPPALPEADSPGPASLPEADSPELAEAVPPTPAGRVAAEGGVSRPTSLRPSRSTPDPTPPRRRGRHSLGDDS